MRTPTFVSKLEAEGTEPLNVRAAPFKAYTAIIGWLKDHALEHGITHEMDGAQWELEKGTLQWPIRRGEGRAWTTNTHIRQVIDEIIWSTTGSEVIP